MYFSNYLESLSGLDAIAEIRRFNRDIPIFMISASEAEREAMKVGANYYLEKGRYSESELNEILARHL